MGYLFIAIRGCTEPTKAKYSVVDNKCWDTCPTLEGQYLKGTVCLPCHYSCETCDNGTFSDCLTCNSSHFRDNVVNKTCFC